MKIVLWVCLGLLMYPDYPLAKTVRTWAEKAGFTFKKKLGNFFYFTLICEK